jgi:hypothetical protein
MITLASFTGIYHMEVWERGTECRKQRMTEDRPLAAQKIIGRVFHRFLQHCAVEIARAKATCENQATSVAQLS